MEGFAELARGARTLKVQSDWGDIVLHLIEGGDWSLDAVAEGGATPFIERNDEALLIRPGALKFTPEFSGENNFGSIVRELASTAARLAGAGAHGTRLELYLTTPGPLEMIELHSGMGSLTLDGAQGQVRVHTGMGNIQVRDCRGSIKADSGAGNITIEDQVGPVKTSTGKGNITISSRAGTVNAHTGMGNIGVELPAGSNIRVDAQTGFGQVESAFSLVQVGRSGPPGFGSMRMVGSSGEGEPRYELKLRSGKGNISLRPRAVQSAAVTVPETTPVSHEARARTGSEDNRVLTLLERLSRGEISPAQAEDMLSALL